MYVRWIIRALTLLHTYEAFSKENENESSNPLKKIWNILFFMTHSLKCHNLKLFPFRNAWQINIRGNCQKMGPITLKISEFHFFCVGLISHFRFLNYNPASLSRYFKITMLFQRYLSCIVILTTMCGTSNLVENPLLTLYPGPKRCMAQTWWGLRASLKK